MSYYQPPLGAPPPNAASRPPHGAPGAPGAPAYGAPPGSYGQGNYGNPNRYDNQPIQQNHTAPGFAAQYRPPPPGADPQLWTWFLDVDADRSGYIGPEELDRALVNGDWTRFDLDTVKLLMTIFDVDRSGTIGFTEFAGLWKYIKDWQNVFRIFDTDRSGSIDRNELANALGQFGYNLSPQLIKLLYTKYMPADKSISSVSTAGPHSNRNAARDGISFDRFIRACVVVKSITEAFTKLDVNRENCIRAMDYDQFMTIVLSLP